MRYLLDSDALINAKDRHYRPAFCGGFWEWILAAHAAGLVFSIDKVRDELRRATKEDHLVAFAKEHDSFFLSTRDVLPEWRRLAQWCQARQPPYKPFAIEQFLAATSADAWLVAYAAHHGDCIIVTNELSAPEGRKSVKLPDAAAALGVRTLSLFDLLESAAKGTFEFVLPQTAHVEQPVI